jgi:hypothetical protein
LTAELADFLESGVSILIGTRSPDLRPLSGRGMGAKVDRARGTVTIYFPSEPCARLIENVRATKVLAATFSRPIDHRSLQIKGSVTSIREGTEEDQAIQAVYRGALMEQLAAIGVSRALSRRVAWFPSVAVEVHVSEMFEQTPGPNAGAPL